MMANVRSYRPIGAHGIEMVDNDVFVCFKRLTIRKLYRLFEHDYLVKIVEFNLNLLLV